MSWLNVTEGTLFLALFPFFLAAYGGHLAAESIPDRRKQKKAKWIFWTLCFLGVIVGFHQQYIAARTEEEAAKEKQKTDEKTEAVQKRIAADLESLHLQGQEKRSVSVPKPPKKTKSTSTILADPVATEMQRRQRILSSLRNEYILSHDNVSPGLMAGTEPPPSDWVNKRLGELGEKWRVNETKAELITQALNLASDLKDCVALVFPEGPVRLHNKGASDKELDCVFKNLAARTLGTKILGMLPKNCTDESTAAFGGPFAWRNSGGKLDFIGPDNKSMVMELTRLANALRTGGC